MPGQDKDQRMKWLSDAILKSAQLIVSVWASLIKYEHYIKRNSHPLVDDSNPSNQDTVYPLAPGEDDLNLSQVIRDLKKGIKIIGMASIQAVQKHRFDLQYKLYGAAKELAESNQKFYDTTFGPNMK